MFEGVKWIYGGGHNWSENYLERIRKTDSSWKHQLKYGKIYVWYNIDLTQNYSFLSNKLDIKVDRQRR